MGSRFGRRKRRAARAQIAELEAKVKVWHSAYVATQIHAGEQRHLLEALRAAFDSWDHRIRRILGSLTAFAITPVAPDRVPRRQHVRVPLQFSAMDGPSISSQVLEMRVYFEEMLSIVAREPRDNLIDLSRYMIVDLRHEDEFERWGCAAYAFSERMWNELREDIAKGDQRAVDFLREDIARQILTIIARDSIKQRSGKHHGVR